jgi:TPR repeat protein
MHVGFHLFRISRRPLAETDSHATQRSDTARIDSSSSTPPVQSRLPTSRQSDVRLSEDVLHPIHQENATNISKSLLCTRPQLLPRLQGGREILRRQIGKVDSPVTDTISKTIDALNEATIRDMGKGATDKTFLDAQILTGQAIALQQYSRSPYALIALLKKYEDALRLCEDAPECLSESNVAIVYDSAERDPTERIYEFLAEGAERNARIGLLERAAKEGRTDAKYTLGLERSDKNFLRRAAREGNLDAQFEYGKRCFGNEKFEEILGAAKQGHAGAQMHLGSMYKRGEGVMRNETEAFKWYKKAAVEQEDASAQYELGKMCGIGIGVTPSDTEAFIWLMEAAKQGHRVAEYIIGNIYKYGKGVTPSDTEAFIWYMKAAKQGFARSQNKVGSMYEAGIGVTQSDTEAFKWYTEAAKKGDAGAQKHLFFLCKKLAEQGDAGAQNTLGYMYFCGIEVTRSDTEAFKWYEQAAKQGLIIAQKNVGHLCESGGDGVTRNVTEAFAWYEKAAEQGDAATQNYLGYVHEIGNGVTRNVTKAFKWYEKAEKQGNTYAEDNLARLREKLRRERLLGPPLPPLPPPQSGPPLSQPPGLFPRLPGLGPPLPPLGPPWPQRSRPGPPPGPPSSRRPGSGPPPPSPPGAGPSLSRRLRPGGPPPPSSLRPPLGSPSPPPPQPPPNYRPPPAPPSSQRPRPSQRPQPGPPPSPPLSQLPLRSGPPPPPPPGWGDQRNRNYT